MSTNREDTSLDIKNHVETKLIFDMYSQEIKAINDLFMEKFTHSEVFEDEMYQQLLAMHEYILKYEKFLNDTLTHLKEEIHKFSNALPKTN
jgi:hypothetical protein